MIIGTSTYVNSIDTAQINVGCDGIVIPIVTSVRNLGLITDSKLTFEDHVKYATYKVNSSVYQLYHLRDYTDINMQKAFVNALMLPHVNYCSAALHGLGSVLDIKLQRLVN